VRPRPEAEGHALALTFERLQSEHDAHVNAALAGMVAKLGLLRERLDGIDFPG
jgi:hypothetical protein